MPKWLTIVLVLAALAVAYKFFVARKMHSPGVPLAAAKGPSKKSRWRRIAGKVGGNALKMAASSVPGGSAALSTASSLTA
jgi:hypothetical protein